MLLLSYLYHISARQVEMLANDSLSVACFLGLGADDKAPDHSSLTLFKNRLLEQRGKDACEESTLISSGCVPARDAPEGDGKRIATA